MFMQRLISSIILAPLVLLIIFYANPWVLGGIIFLITVLAGKECWQLIPLDELLLKAGFIVLLILFVWACGYLFPYWQTVGLVTWILVCIAIITFPNSQSYWGYPVVVASVCLLLLPLFLQSLIHVYLLPQGKSLLVYLLFLIWAADIGAYLVGKFLGKHKLIPQVSPGKSWEGVSGGFILAMAVAGLGYLYYIPYSKTIWFALAAFTIIISIFGDLFISILKRRCHLKDTGSIIPGHGGILDRLDSLIAALPVFYFGLTYIPLGI
jgi:phosphatidate cytidylyltransferase